MKDSLTIDLSYFGYTIIGVTMGIYSIGEKQTDFCNLLVCSCGNKCGNRNMENIRANKQAQR